MAVIDVLYDEGNKKDLQYKCVQASFTSRKTKKNFASGDFVKDWYDCMKFIITNEKTNKEPIYHSSSVEHFIMDGAPYDSAYLQQINGKPFLKYINYKDKAYLFSQLDVYMTGIEFFVKKGTRPTWRKLRTLCFDPQGEK